MKVGDCMTKIGRIFAVSLLLTNIAVNVHAEHVAGYAYIVNNNLMKAEEDARRDAMRNYVEGKLGVHVESTSKMKNFVVESDYVISHSDGYVIQKAIVSKAQKGDIFEIVMDLEAGSKPMDITNVREYLLTLSRNASRKSLDYAFVNDDAPNDDSVNSLVASRLEAEGFKVTVNRAVFSLLSQQASGIIKLDPFAFTNEVRSKGLTARRSASKAIANGHVRIMTRGTDIGGRYYAIAEIVGSIVGYESDTANPISIRAKGVGRTAIEAEANAKENVIVQAASYLAKSAAMTVQQEERGGTQELETTFIFTGICDKAAEENSIINAIEQAGCEVDRYTFVGDNLEVFVVSNNFAKMRDLVDAIVRNVRINYSSAYQTDENNGGSQGYIVKLRG